MTTKEALEKAICADFGDLTLHSAYADLLQEEGNPHGEFIAVQVALEDENLSREEREQLAARERELMNEHGPVWLERVFPRIGENLRDGAFRFSRGWLESAHLAHTNYRMVDWLASAPLSRFLQRLEIDYGYESPHDGWDHERQEMFLPLPIPPDTPEGSEIYLALREAPFLDALRFFRIGEIHGNPYELFNSSGNAQLLHEVLAHTPRLEELHILTSTRCYPRFDPSAIFRLNLPNLRVLRAYNLFNHATDVLAANASLNSLKELMFHSHADDPCIDQRGPYLTLTDLRNVLRSEHLQGLTHLEFRLSDIGDEGCAEIVACGALKRLKVLDLQHGRITDEGARHLAESGDLKNLTRLNLSCNALSPTGIEMLRRSDVPLNAHGQHATDDTNWLTDGDCE